MCLCTTMAYSLSTHIEDCLNTSASATKVLYNGTVKWYQIKGTSYNVIYTHWLDGCIHLEYRNMKDVRDVKVIYSDLPEQQKMAMFKNIQDVTGYHFDSITQD